ncbi:plancitoxin-1-like [Saccoglossus kowalevskii]
MYNDEWPNGKTSTNRGHTKGDLCLDDESGFWLVHSTPVFPNFSNESYSWPENAHAYGQTFLCMTFAYDQFNYIARQLLYYWPSVFDYNIPKLFAANLPDLVQVAKGKHNSDPPWNRSTELISQGGQKFHCFAKSSQYGKDIFSAWLAPYYGDNMYSETWQNGRG